MSNANAVHQRVLQGSVDPQAQEHDQEQRRDSLGGLVGKFFTSQ